MATDFSYGNKAIESSGPIKPSGKNQPLDPRTEVKLYADIETIPNPYVGMIITVLEDETNQNKMTDYKVLSLKANSLGIANSVVDQVQRYIDYLGIASSGTGLTSEQEAKLNSIDNKVDKINGKGLSTNDYTNEEKQTVASLKATVGDTSSGLVKDVKDIKNIKLENLNTAIQTLETLVGLDETLGDKSGLPSGDANVIASINRIDSANNILISPDNSRFKLIVDNSGNLSTEKINEYGQIILSTEVLTINEGESGSFKVKLNSAPTQDEVINLSVDNSNCTVSPTQLTFNSTNYSVEQTVTVNTTRDSSSYDDKNSVITLSNDNINSKTVNVTIVNTDVSEPEVASIELNKETSSLNIGETETLTYILTPEGATSTVTWSTDRDSVATVNNGTVEGISAGTAIITATTDNNKTDSCTFTIIDNTVVADPDNLFTESCLNYTVKGTENGRTGYYISPSPDGTIISYAFDNLKGYTIKATIYDYGESGAWKYMNAYRNVEGKWNQIATGASVDNGDNSYTYTINAAAGILSSDTFIAIKSGLNNILIYDISIKES